MKALACGALVVIVSLHAMPASAWWPVGFRVDDQRIASLTLGEEFTGPVKLAGRSGPAGDDERSGLFDNVWLTYILGSHGWIHLEDHFDYPDTLLFWGWELYGGPTSRLLMDFGNPAPCLMTCGDSLYASGLYSLDPVYPDVESWQLSADVYLGSTDEFNTIELGIGSTLSPEGPPGEQTLAHVVGMTWTTNSRGERIIRCVTDIESVDVPVSHLTSGWHTFQISGLGFSPVERATWGRVKALFR